MDGHAELPGGMTENAARKLAFKAYDFGIEAIRFRSVIEQNYVCAFDEGVYDSKDGEPGLNGLQPVEHVLRHLTIRGRAITNDLSATEITEHIRNLIDSAKMMRNKLEEKWRKDDHRDRVQERLEHAQCDSNLPFPDWEVLCESPFGQSAWLHYESAANALGYKLAPPLGDLFLLGRTLAYLLYPVADNPPRDRDRVFNSEYFLEVVMQEST